MMRRAQWFLISLPILRMGCRQVRSVIVPRRALFVYFMGVGEDIPSRALAASALSEEATATTMTTTASSSDRLLVWGLEGNVSDV